MSRLVLVIAVVAEVIGTSALNASQGFTRFWPSCLTVVAYGAAFYFLSIAMRTIPVGIVYATWSAVGIVLIALVARVWFKQELDAPAVIGMALIVAGVVVMSGFSKTTVH